MEYVCKGCDYNTIYQTNYKKHLETKKHKAKMAEPFASTAVKNLSIVN